MWEEIQSCELDSKPVLGVGTTAQDFLFQATSCALSRSSLRW